jgi:hypothetical protein
MRTLDPQRIESTCTFRAKEGEYFELFFAEPPELVHQHIVSLGVTLRGSDDAVPLRHVDLPLDPNGYGGRIHSLMLRGPAVAVIKLVWHFRLRYLDLRHERDTEPLPELTEEERAHFTQEEPERAGWSKYNFSKPNFQEWLDRNSLRWNKSRQSVFEFVHLAQSTIHRICMYSAKDELRGCGMGGVDENVKVGETDCGGFALLLSSICRASGIPARVVQGQLVDFRREYTHRDDIRQAEFDLGFHANCKLRTRVCAFALIYSAEFWADGVGWVPVESTDPTAASLGRDRRKPFLTRHFDYLWDLPSANGRTLRPVFMSIPYPFAIEAPASVNRRTLWADFSRHEWRHVVDEKTQRCTVS